MIKDDRNRYHPMAMLHDYIHLIKKTVPLFFLAFVLKADSSAWLFTYGRYILPAAVICSALYIPVKWYTKTYEILPSAIVVTSKLFTTSTKTIPYSKIQQVKRKTTWVHRLLGMTSLTLETSAEGRDGTVRFDVLRPSEASSMEQRVQQEKPDVERETFLEKQDQENAQEDNHEQEEVEQAAAATPVDQKEPRVIGDEKTIHFKPTKKDLIKASLASLSFLAVIPLAGSRLSDAEDLHFEKQVDGLFESLLSSIGMIVGALAVLTVIGVGLGFVRTYKKYGKYELASTSERIFITKGAWEQDYLSVRKDHVQAVLIEQSLMKRLLGFASLKLVIAGENEGEEEVTSVYPFLPVKRAYSLVHEVLPDYRVLGNMDRLPRRAFYLRLLRPSWIWVAVTGGLYFFKPGSFFIDLPWWAFSSALFVIIVLSRIQGCVHSRFQMDDTFIQFQAGGFTKTLYLSKRSKVIELEVSRNYVQQKSGLASVKLINRANPVRETIMNDVPDEFAERLKVWYTHQTLKRKAS
ncbi:PH domain-containing protein [Halobacillus sp. Cin3]|uniref:PH domain-containing protein n=1 Tax=Halobacillus sp. Cin3 TaxID=2928441 RepID=UPI00248E779B|nr:PH domain-containing protein [Halobacillus sp. Cin3]